MIKSIILVSSILILSACTSAPVNIEYYSLNPKTEAPSSTNKNTAELPLIVIEAVQLAEFLRQQGIVVETGSNQLHMSSQHRWAERLDEAISRNLIAQLEERLDQYRFESHNTRWSKQPTYRINFSFSHFHSTENNQAVVAGNFWILDQENKLLNKQRFYLSRDLTQNGYSHSVEQLNLTLRELVNFVANNLQSLG